MSVAEEQSWIAQRSELLRQLSEANDTIDAIRTGMVDALVVQGRDGNELYTLRSADQTYRVFIEKMREGAVTLNHEGVILYCNSQFARMIGFPLEKVIGYTLEEFVAPYFLAQFRAVLVRADVDESRAEIELVTGADQKIPFLISCSPLEMADGASLSVLLTDLTIQKRNEHQLKIKNEQLLAARNATASLNNELESLVRKRTNELFESREYFKFLADNIPVIIFTADATGNLYCNQRWYTYTGLSLDQSRERGWELVVHPDDLGATTLKWRESLSSGRRFEIHYRLRRIDGAYRWHQGLSSPFRNEKGEIVTWIGTCIDIDDQIRSLEKKDEFIGIASHELKTPLTSLKGYIQLINNFEDDRLPPIIKKYASKASEAEFKLSTLVNDLLDVSKIHAGKFSFRTGWINLSELVHSWIETTNHLYPDFTVGVTVEEGVFIIGSEERLEQVFMNLVNNAVKYSETRHELLVQLSRSGPEVKISVTDFGFGMTEEQKQKIFERFYRVEGTKFLTSGLGMGLYIAQQIVKEHNGYIEVDTQIGVGSTFQVTLPVSSSRVSTEHTKVDN